MALASSTVWHSMMIWAMRGQPLCGTAVMSAHTYGSHTAPVTDSGWRQYRQHNHLRADADAVSCHAECTLPLAPVLACMVDIMVRQQQSSTSAAESLSEACRAAGRLDMLPVMIASVVPVVPAASGAQSLHSCLVTTDQLRLCLHAFSQVG